MLVAESDIGFRYWAFISYSHQDKAWGRWLQRALETYRVPRRLVGQPAACGVIPARLAPVFRDRDELATATDLGDTVGEALRQSWCLIVICSRAAAESRWVNEEVRRFQQLGRTARIHCLLVDGLPDAIAPSLPPVLRQRLDEGAGEPIAADARRSGDGKAHARLKLVAGILGVSFDKLVQREQQRGYRRMAAIAAAAVLALAVLSAFTLATVRARRDAESQRAHAESLVEFMLGDLRNKLQPEGRLATLDAVGKAALAYYQAQDPASLGADALARRARALHMIGDVYDQRGELDAALAVFKQAAATTAELLARDGDNPQRVFDHAQSTFWVGLIAFQRGEADVAETAFRNYQSLAQRLVGFDPDNADWAAEAEYAHSNLGSLWLDQGRADAAADAFEQALQIAQALARRAPGDVARQSELAQSRAWLADARVLQGRFDDAVAQRQAQLVIYENMLATDQNSRDAQAGSLVAERELGAIARLRGDDALALSQLRRAMALGNDLMAVDADNTETLQLVAATGADLGEALADTGDGVAARAAVERSRALAARLVARDATVMDWQSQLVRSQVLQATLAAESGDVIAAQRVVQGVEERLDGLRQNHRLSRRARLALARAQLLSAELDDRFGHADVARDRRLRLLDALRGEQAQGPREDALLATVLLQLGRGDEARAIRVHLEAIGYRAPDFVAAMAGGASGRSARGRDAAPTTTQ